MLPLATRQAAKCIPELCTRHTSPGSPRNPSPERERAGGSARPPLRSHSRRLPALAGRLFPPARTSQGLGPVRCKCLLRGDSALLPLPSRAAARGSVARAFKTKRMNEAFVITATLWNRALQTSARMGYRNRAQRLFPPHSEAEGGGR